MSFTQRTEFSPFNVLLMRSHQWKVSQLMARMIDDNLIDISFP